MIPNGKEKLVRATLLLSSADLPAKSLLSNMTRLMEKRAAQSVKMKGRQRAVADYTESGPILPTWY